MSWNRFLKYTKDFKLMPISLFNAAITLKYFLCFTSPFSFEGRIELPE